MTTEAAETIERRIARETGRGEFAYWPKDDEIAWHLQAPRRPTLAEVAAACPAVSMSGVAVVANHHAVTKSKYHQWDAQIECGKGYLVGEDVPLDEFLAKHTTPLIGGRPQLWQWAMDNPFYKLVLRPAGQWYEVYKSGDDFVEFALPHHDYGGEKNWVSRDGKTQVLVNLD